MGGRAVSVLSEALDFDHVIELLPNGQVNTHPESGLYAPEALDVAANDTTLQDWTLPLSGLTGQHGYSGPWLHDSELIEGGVERAIRRNGAGYYVAIYGQHTAECPECSQAGVVYDENGEEVPCPNIASGTCSPDGYSGQDAETIIEGWTVAYKPSPARIALDAAPADAGICGHCQRDLVLVEDIEGLCPSCFHEEHGDSIELEFVA